MPPLRRSRRIARREERREDNVPMALVVKRNALGLKSWKGFKQDHADAGVRSLFRKFPREKRRYISSKQGQLPTRTKRRRHKVNGFYRGGGLMDTLRSAHDHVKKHRWVSRATRAVGLTKVSKAAHALGYGHHSGPGFVKF